MMKYYNIIRGFMIAMFGDNDVYYDTSVRDDIYNAFYTRYPLRKEYASLHTFVNSLMPKCRENFTFEYIGKHFKCVQKNYYVQNL